MFKHALRNSVFVFRNDQLIIYLNELIIRRNETKRNLVYHFSGFIVWSVHTRCVRNLLSKPTIRRLILSLAAAFNSFNPEFMKWSFSSLKLDASIVANTFAVKNHNKMANSVVPADMTPSHQNLHVYCLHRCLVLVCRAERVNSFGAKFQTTFVVCFFILTNYRLERRLYVKLKDWMSNSVDSDETAHWAVSSGSMLFAKAYYYACGSERVIILHVRPTGTALPKPCSTHINNPIVLRAAWPNMVTQALYLNCICSNANVSVIFLGRRIRKWQWNVTR